MQPTWDARSATCIRSPWTCRPVSRNAMPPAFRGADSRTQRASARSSKECAVQMADASRLHDLPDERGHFGPYGGIFVAETLISALDELKTRYEHYRSDSDFIAEFERELAHYV